MSRKEKTDKRREELKGMLRYLYDPQQGTSKDAGNEKISSSKAEQLQQQTVDEEVGEQTLQKEDNEIKGDEKDNSKKGEKVQKKEQNQENNGTVKEVKVEEIQNARKWTPLSTGEHPRLEDIMDIYPDMPEGHPEPLFLFAVRSRNNGYWLWMPKTRNFCGPVPRNGIAARVEKVRHDGKEFKMIGYGTKVGNIQVWYDYKEVMKFFPRFFEPERETQSFSNTEYFPEGELKKEINGGDNRRRKDQGKDHQGRKHGEHSGYRREDKSRRF